ncbi:hypothetical protein B296_00037047 [Ensete ventricosum]|uniref:Uncharacterized protein n=1 Tax=Ensete ventricosum TaxID=4639 RepID=A0A426YXZ8_ENSVE|nr:hypothetical protein B296_00037047 [Ensete ventricosum]
MSEQAPLGDAIKQPESVPCTSTHNFSDPDTLSSDSTGSLREQLCLVNQRINDVRRTLKMKDEHTEGPLRGSPFIQEIQDAHISSHFHLPMLEAYDGSSDPTEHVAAFYAQMTLYGTSDAIMCFYDRDQTFPPFLVACRAPPITVLEMLYRVNQYVTAETLMVEKHEDQKRPRDPRKGTLKDSQPTRSRVEDRDHRCYCRFHRDYGHDIKEYYDLKNQIEDLIHCGHLDRYIRKPRKPSLRPKGPVE